MHIPASNEVQRQVDQVRVESHDDTFLPYLTLPYLRVLRSTYTTQVGVCVVTSSSEGANAVGRKLFPTMHLYSYIPYLRYREREL